MKFNKVNIIKKGENYKDVKDRIFHEVKFKPSVRVLKNMSPMEVGDLGFADNFRIEEDVVYCDVTIYDKFDEEVKPFVEGEFYAHPFMAGEPKKLPNGFKVLKTITITGLFLNKMKLYPDFKCLKEVIKK